MPRSKRPNAMFEQVGDGSFAVNLPGPVRTLLATLPSQLRALIDRDDPSLMRLFPTAYNDHPEFDDEFHELMRSDLVEHKLRSADVLERTAEAATLTEAELSAWMGALNDLRLVVGTQLGVDEDIELEDLIEDEGDEVLVEVYEVLTVIVGGAIDALSRLLPDIPPEPDIDGDIL